MSHEKFEMCLIIPFRYDCSRYDEIGTEKTAESEKYFHLKKMKCQIINLQNDDLWNDYGGVVKCLEIRQKYRGMLGLHHKEDNIYFFRKRPDISFRITKVYGWFLRSGTVYITVQIKADDLSEDQVLDLRNMLVNTKENNKIEYTARTGKDTSEERMFTVRDLIRTFIELLEFLDPVEQKITYSAALSLSYGIADGLSEEAMSVFSENMRNNKKSAQRLAKEIGKESFFIPEEYPYLYWAVSDNVLTLTADIGQAVGRDEGNRVFLCENLPHLIFTNYLMLYLYYQGIQEQCAELERQCRMADKNMCMYPEAVQVQSLKKDVTELTDINHINELFCRYLCENTWKLRNRLEAVEEILEREGKNRRNSSAGNRDNAEGKYEIFISYRRVYGGYAARLIYNELREHDMTAFYDLKSMRTGKFDEQIRNAVRNAEYVIAVLTPGCLDPCGDEDWMREELMLALETDKKIINVMVDGFDFPEELPENLKQITKRHGLHMNAEYIDSFMEALLEQIERDRQSEEDRNGRKTGACLS